MENGRPTQSKHPQRAMWRTIIAVALAMLPVLPQIAGELGVATYGWAVAVLAIAAAITRILAIPQVNAALRASGVLTWLAAEPRAPYVRPRRGEPPA